MPTPEEIAAQEKAEQERAKQVEALELNDDDNSAIDAQLKEEHKDLVGDALKEKRNEVTKSYKEKLLKEAEEDAKKFDEIKAEDDWKEKTDEEIWAELERREEEGESSNSLSDVLGLSSEDHKGDKGGKGKKADKETSEKLVEAQQKLANYNSMFEKDPMLKNYMTAAQSGQKKLLIDTLRENPVLTLDLSDLKNNGKRAYEAHLRDLNRKFGDSVITAEQISDSLEAFDDLEAEDKAKKLSEAATYLKKAQSEGLNELGLTLDEKAEQASSGKPDTKAMKELFKTQLDKLKGTTKLGLKLDAKRVDALYKHIGSGGFNIMDQETGQVNAEKVILYSLIDLYPQEMAQALYDLGANEKAKTLSKKKSRSRSLAKSGGVRGSGSNHSWEQHKKSEEAAGKKAPVTL